MRCLVTIAILLYGLLVVAPCRCEEDRSADDLAAGDHYTAEERGHWSFQLPVLPAPPVMVSAADRRWAQTPIDQFILAKLQQAGLKPAPPADRRVLIRRVYYDLIGLPPTPQQVDAFVNDSSPLAYKRLVDTLLASPHYGERWGQHWLDVVRFAETEGFEYDQHHDEAWRFRDYVIRAFNDDKPYDQFLKEQLAGDELFAAIAGSSAEEQQDDATATVTQEDDRLVAVGFYRLGPVRRNAGNAEVAFSRNEVLTERIDTVGAAFLGLTVGCARCHDHMFDPIRQQDYYRLQAFLAAAHAYDAPLATAEVYQDWKRRTDAINREIKIIRDAISNAGGEEEQQLKAKMAAARDRLPKPLPTLFSIRNATDQLTPIHLLKRGDEGRPGKKLGMRALGVLLPDGTPELPAETAAPRTALANWIADSANPLTARVMVNRIWLYHFGEGLVDTPNDFGRNGNPPSHPQLLDYLAATFANNGWSIKSMHRLILHSNTYRQSSTTPDVADGIAKDAANRLLWRFPRRRLDAEEIRDSLLAVSGELNPRTGGPSIMVPVDQQLIDLLYKPTQWQVTADPGEHNRRSIYLIAKRNLRLPFLDVFDQPDLQTSCFRRIASTHAPQALELLNGRISNELAEAFANRLVRDAGSETSQQVDWAFRLATGRTPSDKERKLALRYLQTQPLREFALAMFNLNAFLYVE